ncbi:inactive peptidyl-prolyl cis-trans isomerase FKBP6 [Aplysia californica]|uniref:peptidylprolyl isomerase n=1 Tax=Aplysia californica TaxID=6500 RepID=A0ABM0JAH4_APLCA|nr:inactive peptidyl-prolyl cis-trans isomerase FKBP6 [Aplysia californica]
MDPFGNDETCTRLKNALDINDLRDPDGEGVEFEVDENDLAQTDQEQDTNLHCFEKNKVAASICLLSDNEDEEDNFEGDGEYLTEKERLHKRLLKMRDSDITPNKDGGVLKEMKTPGIGGLVAEGALVSFHYNAYTDVGQAPYDSSRLRDQYSKLRLGTGQCIRGLELALLSMKKHETARFLIHHDYAYGEMGCPPRIPKSTSLIYDVEILYFVEQEGVEDYHNMTEEERRQKLTYVDIEKVVKALNAEGKEYFEKREYHRALGKYRKAEEVLQRYNLKNEEEQTQWTKQSLRVYLNCATCSNYLKQFGRVISYCNNALRLDRNAVKAHYFKGKALHSLGSFEDAKQSLRTARNLKPSDMLINNALKDLAKSIKEHTSFEKSLYRKMFSQPASDAGETSGDKEKEESVERPSQPPCSDGFRALVQEQFEKFKNDPCMTEMPFPERQMTENEIACILETATALGMDVRKRGTGNSLRFEVYKQ